MFFWDMIHATRLYKLEESDRINEELMHYLC